MSDLAEFNALLARHIPVVRYDSHEVYFADSAAEWTDSPGQVLHREPQGEVLAKTPGSLPTPLLSLSFLAPGKYANGVVVEHEDVIGCPTKNYAELARRLHVEPGYANRVYGRAASGSDNRVWLQYWFFYFYNDLELLGDEFPAGLHEGDWEMIQLRLDDQALVPDLAVYAKHKHADARFWGEVELVEENRPVIYVARGSHAAYFTAGTHWGEAWFDHADGKGFRPDLTLEIAGDEDPNYAWIRWPGFWGDTKPQSGDLLEFLDDSSPRGPAGHAQWKDPHALLTTVKNYRHFEPGTPVSPATPPAAPTAPEPAAPNITLSRTPGGFLQVAYSSADWPAQLAPARLIVTVNSPQDPLPPIAQSLPISAAQGSVETPIELRPEWTYHVNVSIAGRANGLGLANGPPLTSSSEHGDLAPA